MTFINVVAALCSRIRQRRALCQTVRLFQADCVVGRIPEAPLPIVMNEYQRIGADEQRHDANGNLV